MTAAETDCKFRRLGPRCSEPSGRTRVSQGLLLISPADLYLFVFMILPLILVVILSFLSRGTYGEVEFMFNASNYARLFDPIYGKILLYSLGVGLGTTVITIADRLSRWHTTLRGPRRDSDRLLLFLILVPFWTNFVIRTYAWIMILRGGGLLDSVLQWAHITSEPLGLLYTPTAVMIGMVYEFLPFMILPLYTSLEKIENALLEAAADLGAPPLAGLPADHRCR